MEIQSHKRNDKLVVSTKGKIDATNSGDFEKKLKGLIDDGENNIVLDFSELEYISSAGLRSILAIAKQLKAQHGNLVVTCLRDIVKEVFEISGFSKIIPVCESVESVFSGE